jgi:hypothetical protein
VDSCLYPFFAKRIIHYILRVFLHGFINRRLSRGECSPDMAGSAALASGRPFRHLQFAIRVVRGEYDPSHVEFLELGIRDPGILPQVSVEPSGRGGPGAVARRSLCGDTGSIDHLV